MSSLAFCVRSRRSSSLLSIYAQSPKLDVAQRVVRSLLLRLSKLLRKSAWFVPAVLLAVGVLLYPALRTLALSFLDVNLANHFHSEFAGAANYVRLIHD